MTKNKKPTKSMSQSVIDVGTSGMPAPIRKFLGSRIIAGLIMLLAPILFATGIVSVSFENGRPHISFNKEKAAHAKELASEKVHDLRGDNDGRGGNPAKGIQSFISHEKKKFESATQRPQGESFIGSMGDRVGSFGQDLTAGPPQQKAQSPQPIFGATKETAPPAKGPISSLRDRFDSRR